MIQPGLERIGLLLKGVHFPWKSIHVAGTNGKGSVCAYASAMLTRRALRVGRFTSPHLVHRWDCIQINDRPIKESIFKAVESEVLELNRKEDIQASEFEVLTATAFHIFNEEKVQFGVVEVGMGGKLDATNILNNQVVSVITKIARDHESFLGNTLEEITRHKAGILRPNTPYIVNPMNEWNVHEVIEEIAKEVGAGPLVRGDTEELNLLWKQKVWREFAPRLLPFQRDNAVTAFLAVREALKVTHPHEVKMRKLIPGLKKAFPGRLQNVKVRPVFGQKPILVDGAHNEDAALVLTEYIDKKFRFVGSNIQVQHDAPPSMGWPVTWVLAMTESKDVHKFLAPLIKAGDTVVVTQFGAVDGMPWVKAMDPMKILRAVKEIQSDTVVIAVPEVGVHRALFTARHLSNIAHPVVLTGSLYLVGSLMQELEKGELDGQVLDMGELEKQERSRVTRFLSTRSKHSHSSDADLLASTKAHERIQRRIEVEVHQRRGTKRLPDEVQSLDEELKAVDAELEIIEGVHEWSDSGPLSPIEPPDPESKPRLRSYSPKHKFYREVDDIRQRLNACSGPLAVREQPEGGKEAVEEAASQTPTNEDSSPNKKA